MHGSIKVAAPVPSLFVKMLVMSNFGHQFTIIGSFSDKTLIDDLEVIHL